MSVNACVLKPSSLPDRHRAGSSLTTMDMTRLGQFGKVGAELRAITTHQRTTKPPTRIRLIARCHRSMSSSCSFTAARSDSFLAGGFSFANGR